MSSEHESDALISLEKTEKAFFAEKIITLNTEVLLVSAKRGTTNSHKV